MKQRITNIFNKKSKLLAILMAAAVVFVIFLTSAIYITTPPENIKVAYFTEPQGLYEFNHDTHNIEDYCSNNYYNIKYEYSVDSDEIRIEGVVNGNKFDVKGAFVTTSYNGARVLYEAEDTLGNYNVKCVKFILAQTTEYTELPIQDHNSGENARHNYFGWFKKYAQQNPEYKNALQVYLNPVGTDDIVIMEIFLEDDFVTEFVTQKNIKYADVDEHKGYYMEMWENEWYKEHGCYN